MLSTIQIKEHLHDVLFSNIQPHVGESLKLDIFFEQAFPNSIEGTYIYSDEHMYHYQVVEMGKFTTDKETTSFDELVYWALSACLFQPSIEFAEKNWDKNMDFRRTLFKYRLTAFSHAGDGVYSYAKKHFDEVLKKNPYVDKPAPNKNDEAR